MANPWHKIHADILLNHSLNVKCRDRVAVTGSQAALPPMKAIYRIVLQSGDQRGTFVAPSWQEYLFLQDASDSVRRSQGPSISRWARGSLVLGEK